MTTREEVIEALNAPTHAPASTHNPADGTCSECPWPVYQLPPDELADALIAAFPHLVQDVYEWEYMPGFLGADGRARVSDETISAFFVDNYVARGGSVVRRKVGPFEEYRGGKA